MKLLVVRSAFATTEADRVFAEFASAHIVQDRRASTDRSLMYEAYETYCSRIGTEPLKGQALRHRFSRLGINSYGKGFRLRYVKFEK